MEESKQEHWNYSHCDGVTIHENKREHEIMTAVLQEQQGEELPTQLKVRQSLVESQCTGRRIADQRPLVKAVWISSKDWKNEEKTTDNCEYSCQP